MAKTTPAQFVREVRNEALKVTWPSRKETIVSTVMVCVISVIAALFFLLADSILSKVVRFILNIGA